MTTRLAFLVFAFMCPVLGSAVEPSDSRQHAHVHGIATLGLAIQDSVVTLTLESPLDSLIGFEHRATTAAERAAVEQLQTRMKSGTGLFEFTAAAECQLNKAEAESAIFDPAPAKPGDGHADLDASFEYRCAHVERLAAVDVGLFNIYPHLQKVSVEVASAKRQFKRELTRARHIVSLQP